MEFIEPNSEAVIKPVCYAIVFDTGYFYIGATDNFEKRKEQHKRLILKNPSKYLISDDNNHTKCIFVKLLSCNSHDKIFKHERDLIIFNAKNELMINGVYGDLLIERSENRINESYRKLINTRIV